MVMSVSCGMALELLCVGAAMLSVVCDVMEMCELLDVCRRGARTARLQAAGAVTCGFGLSAGQTAPAAVNEGGTRTGDG